MKKLFAKSLIPLPFLFLFLNFVLPGVLTQAELVEGKASGNYPFKALTRVVANVYLRPNSNDGINIQWPKPKKKDDPLYSVLLSVQSIASDFPLKERRKLPSNSNAYLESFKTKDYSILYFQPHIDDQKEKDIVVYLLDNVNKKILPIKTPLHIDGSTGVNRIIGLSDADGQLDLWTCQNGSLFKHPINRDQATIEAPVLVKDFKNLGYGINFRNLNGKIKGVVTVYTDSATNFYYVDDKDQLHDFKLNHFTKQQQEMLIGNLNATKDHIFTYLSYVDKEEPSTTISSADSNSDSNKNYGKIFVLSPKDGQFKTIGELGDNMRILTGTTDKTEILALSNIDNKTARLEAIRPEDGQVLASQDLNLKGLKDGEIVKLFYYDNYHSN